MELLPALQPPNPRGERVTSRTPGCPQPRRRRKQRTAPARIYIPELLSGVLDGCISPALVFEYETDLAHIADAYRAVDERRAIKSLVRVGTV